MNGSSEKFGERVRDLTVRFGADAMRSLQRYNELLQRMAGGEFDDGAASEAYVQFVRDEAERYFRSAAELSTGYYDALLELGSIYNPPFFENVFNQRPPRGQTSSRRQGGVIELRGSPGEEVAGTFRVENDGTAGRR